MSEPGYNTSPLMYNHTAVIEFCSPWVSDTTTHVTRQVGVHSPTRCSVTSIHQSKQTNRFRGESFNCISLNCADYTSNLVVTGHCMVVPQLPFSTPLSTNEMKPSTASRDWRCHRGRMAFKWPICDTGGLTVACVTCCVLDVGQHHGIDWQ